MSPEHSPATSRPTPVCLDPEERKDETNGNAEHGKVTARMRCISNKENKKERRHTSQVRALLILHNDCSQGTFPVGLDTVQTVFGCQRLHWISAGDDCLGE